MVFGTLLSLVFALFLSACSQSQQQQQMNTHATTGVAGKTVSFTFSQGTGVFAGFTGKTIVDTFAATGGTFTATSNIAGMAKHIGIFKEQFNASNNSDTLSVTHKSGKYASMRYIANLNFNNNTFTLKGTFRGKPITASGSFQVMQK